MRTIHQIRLENVRALAEEFKSQSEFADAIGKVPTQVSRFMGKNPTKNIGNDLAEEIEKALGLEEGALDIPNLNSNTRGYQSSKYQEADQGHKEIVDEVADELLNMSMEEAERLKKAMELLRGKNSP